MKFFLSLVAAFLTATAAMGATSVPAIDDSFDVDKFAQLDVKDKAESIKRTWDTGTLQGTRYAWGGFCPTTAGGASNETQVYLGAGADALIFKMYSMVTNARAYTRFDTTTAVTAACTVNDVQLDASAAGYGCKLTGVTSTQPLKLAVLIRDNDLWYQSSSLDVPITTGAIDLVYPFGTGGVTWQQMDPANAGVIDMDKVNNAGETTTALLTGAATPTLNLITGMGVIITDGAGGTSSTDNLFINRMTIQNDVVAPAAPVATNATPDGATTVTINWTAVSGAAGYDVYRAATAGGVPTKLTTTPITATTYNDTTVALNTMYYYTVKAVDAAVPAPNSSAASAEIAAQAKVISGAKKWFRFF